MNKSLSITSVIVLTCFLCACHKNPLKVHSEQKSTRFLINASVAAEKKLHLGLDESTAQRVYLNCMTGTDLTVDCPAFYQAMVHFSKEGPFSEFKGITIADLSDVAVFKTLQEGYEERFFLNNLEN